MVPEYLTPTNGGLLSPGQLMALARTVLGQHGGPGVAELVLEVTPDVMVGKVSCGRLCVARLTMQAAENTGRLAGSLSAC